MEDITQSLRKALIDQNWYHGDKVARVGNPYVWVDAEKMELPIHQLPDLAGLLFYLSMLYEEYPTPPEMQTDDYEVMKQYLEKNIGDCVRHYLPFLDGEIYTNYVNCTSLVRAQDYSYIKTYAGVRQKNNPTLLRPENELVRLIFKELKLAKQLRIEAEKYQQEMGARARSQAHMLLLRARLATQKEIIAEFKHKANEEIRIEIERFKRRANEEMQKEIIAEFKRAADEEMQKEMAELISTANQEIQKEIEQFRCKINEETHEIQQVLTDIRTIRIAADNELKIQQKLTDAGRIIALTSSSQ